MLLELDLKSKITTRIQPRRLSDFGLDERGLQSYLFKNLDKLLPEDELMIIAQSAQGNEEPDMFAFDKEGRLYIFELKIWEAKNENLLQALKYGQIFGQKEYSFFEKLFKRDNKIPLSLQEAHKNHFDLPKELEIEKFNAEKQVFIVLTNGIDFKTREAILYWKAQGLEVRSWIYRVYGDTAKKLVQLEINPYRATDMPYEDKSDGFYFVNTNMKNNPTGEDEATMFREQIVATYFDHWKEKMNLLNKGNTVFLYRSGQNNGIVAMGEVEGEVKARDYKGYSNEEYYRKLKNFVILKKPLSPSEIRKIIGMQLSYIPCVFSTSYENGTTLKKYILENNS